MKRQKRYRDSILDRLAKNPSMACEPLRYIMNPLMVLPPETDTGRDTMVPERSAHTGKTAPKANNETR